MKNTIMEKFKTQWLVSIGEWRLQRKETVNLKED